MAAPPSPPVTAAALREAPPPTSRPQLIDLKEVCRRTGLGRTTIQKLIVAGTFPRKVKITPVIVRWSAAAVDQWIEDRIAAAGPGR